MPLRASWASIVVAILALLAGCAPIESEVDYVEPTPSAVTVSADFMIEVGFDHGMDPTTITTATFIVRGDQSGSHSGAYLFLGGDTIVQFESTNPFIEGEFVTVRLTDGIRSHSKKDLDPYSWTFQVMPPPFVPPTPFHIVSLTPAIESVDGPRTGTIGIQLANPYNPFNVASGSVLVEGSRSGKRTVTFTDLFTGGSTLRLNVNRGFIAGERVSVSVTALLLSITGTNAPPSVVSYTARNLGSLWPTASIDSGSGLVGGHVVFLDADADGFEEWVVVAANGTVTAQDVDASGPTASTTFSLGQSVADTAVGDFDGDGRADLVVLLASGNAVRLFTGSASLAVLFDAPTTINLARPAAGLSVGHADPDGVIDLLLHDSTGAAIAWGSASSPLTAQLTLPAVAPIAPLAVGDLDGDALPDFAVPIVGGAIRILRGLEGRAFTTSFDLVPSSPATGVVAVSLDGDDLIDLIATAGSGMMATAFLPNGAMDFDSLALFADVAGTGAIVADWDGDGASDLLAPVPGAVGVRIASGLGNGNLLAPVSETTAAPVARLTLGDTNGDGVLDVAMVLTDGTWEVSLGTAANPPLVDTISVDDIAANAGASGVSYVVRADNEVTVEGYTIVLGFDPVVLTLDSIRTLGTDAGALGVEFEIPNINNVTGTAILAVILDFLPPYDGTLLASGSGQSIATGTFSVASSASGTTSLAPTDGLGSPPSDNSFVAGGLSIFPALVAGTVTIGGGPPPPSDPPFIRGDSNRDGSVDVSDGTFIQNWLQSGGAGPTCLDAADVNDDGAVDLGDSVFLFNYLFTGSTPPSAPFPLTGSDPTTDLLDCAQ